MALRIFNNLNSAVAQRVLGDNNAKLADAIARVAAGRRILRSSDDNAGSAISENLNSDTQTLRQGAKNLSDARKMIDIADSAFSEVSSILIRLRELASQSATGTIGQTERESLQLEFNALRNEVDRIAKTSEYNGVKLLSGTLGNDSAIQAVIQIGLSAGESDQINLSRDVNIKETNTATLGVDKLTINTAEGSVDALGTLKIAISKVSSDRARIGATQNRLQIASNSLSINIQSLAGAASAISDADMAEELALLTRQQLLVSSSAAMVGQANLIPQNVLRLFQT